MTIMSLSCSHFWLLTAAALLAGCGGRSRSVADADTDVAADGDLDTADDTGADATIDVGADTGTDADDDATLCPEVEILRPEPGDVFCPTSDALDRFPGVQIEVFLASSCPDCEEMWAVATGGVVLDLPFGTAECSGGEALVYVTIPDASCSIEAFVQDIHGNVSTDTVDVVWADGC